MFLVCALSQCDFVISFGFALESDGLYVPCHITLAVCLISTDAVDILRKVLDLQHVVDSLLHQALPRQHLSPRVALPPRRYK